MKSNQERARDVIATMEKGLGFSLDQVAVSDRDQYMAALREDLTSMGVDPTNAAELRAVFTGAYMLAVSVLPYSYVSPVTAGSAAMVLRSLADRADDPFPSFDEEETAPDAVTESWWQRLRRGLHFR